MIMGVDVDDTCLDMVEEWITAYNIASGDNLKKKDIRSWDIASYAKRMSKKDFYKLLVPSLYDKVKPIKGALEGVNSLREFGRVIFVTSNFGDIGRPKLEALNRLGFSVDKKDFYEAFDKSLIACNFLFDDNVDNAKNAYGQGVLFNAPWNEDSDYSPRVYDWKDAIAYMRGGFA